MENENKIVSILKNLKNNGFFEGINDKDFSLKLNLILEKKMIQKEVNTLFSKIGFVIDAEIDCGIIEYYEDYIYKLIKISDNIFNIEKIEF